MILQMGILHECLTISNLIFVSVCACLYDSEWMYMEVRFSVVRM